MKKGKDAEFTARGCAGNLVVAPLLLPSGPCPQVMDREPSAPELRAADAAAVATQPVAVVEAERVATPAEGCACGPFRLIQWKVDDLGPDRPPSQSPCQTGAGQLVGSREAESFPALSYRLGATVNAKLLPRLRHV